MDLDDNFNPEDKEERSESTPKIKMIESLRKETAILGEALCITTIYLGIGTAIYRGCTSPGEEEKNAEKVQEMYEPAVDLFGIPLQ